MEFSVRIHFTCGGESGAYRMSVAGKLRAFFGARRGRCFMAETLAGVSAHVY
jgi:hypothetical protein